MTKPEQIKFVRDLSKGVADELVSQIQSGKIPDSWDGHELRCLLAERHTQSSRMSLIAREPRRRRARNYRNTVIVQNL